MRLICPNCGAQYEVDPSMIPADGRDVQCSNCVTTWFQPGAGSAEALADKPNGAAPAAPEAPAPARTPRRRETSSEALDIIRQEAAREARMREAEALETQEEMPLDAPDDAVERGRQARAQIAGLTRPEPEVEGDAEPAPSAMAPPPEPPRQAVAEPEPEPEEIAHNGSRRDLLPDIEEINSTLHPDEISAAAEAEAALSDEAVLARGAQRTGRRVGFMLSIVIAVVAVVLYVLAPVIAERAPAMATALESYVTWVNAVRVQINDLFEGMATSLASMTQG